MFRFLWFLHFLSLFSSEDWRYRHAALMAVSACGEGCHTQMELMLDEIVNAVLPYLTDPVSESVSF